MELHKNVNQYWTRGGQYVVGKKKERSSLKRSHFLVRIFSPSPPLARKWRNKYDEDEGQINKGHFRAEETGGRWTWQGSFELVTVSSTYGFCFDDLKQRGLCCISERSNALAAATAAESLQSCPTLCDPIDGKPTRLPRPWGSPGKNTGVGCHVLLQCM